MPDRGHNVGDQAFDRKLDLREIGPSDIEEVARFIARVSESKTPLSRAIERLSWILLDNPARVSGDPLGWQLRTHSGDIVGCMCCAPQKFCLGAAQYTLMMANSFYVDQAYRGSGASIFLKYFQLGRRYPLFVSSANPIVAEMWRKLGGYSIGNSDREVMGILRWPAVLTESVYRKTGNDFAARFLGAVSSPWLPARNQLLLTSNEGKLAPLGSPDEGAGVCAQHHSEKIANCRDTAFLKWRYFSYVASETQLFAFTPAGQTKQIMVAVAVQHRGYKQQIRALHVLDVWGEVDPDTLRAIAACLWREYRERIDMLVFRCLDEAQQQALTDHGFRVRPFEAPIAWCIDKHGLLPTKNWHFVPADGDMFL